MKILRNAALAVLALGTAALSSPQDPRVLATHKPVIHEVGHGMAIAPGRIAVLGENLGLIRTVRLDGVEIPVVRNTGTRLVLAPEPGQPGFHALDFVHAQGKLERVLELTPNIAARRAGDYLAVTVHGSDRGFYELAYSLSPASEPLYYPGINFANRLDMTSPYSGIAYAAYLPDGNQATVLWRVPPMMAIQSTIHLQALCASLDGVLCYSNAIRVLPAFAQQNVLR